MKVFDILNKIQENAMLLYPEELFKEYRILENSYLEENEANKKLAANNIAKIKASLKNRKMDVDWPLFFNDLIEKVEYDEEISLKDIVTLEYAPIEMSKYLKRIAEIVANRRNIKNDENVRLCKSIYGFTKCLEPCAYGSYGSCLFAARGDDGTSVAEKLLGNITTPEEYVKEMRLASQYSNNLKLITTSHKAKSEVLEVILSAVKTARNDNEFKSFPICVSIGSLDEKQIILLKEAGVTRINHNLETSYYNALYLSTIANNNDNGLSTDSANEYQRRLTTLCTALENAMGICSGGMFFYGDDEIAEDRILLYLTLKELDKIYENNSSPFNVYVPLKEIIDVSIGWFNAFELPCVEREQTIDSFTIFKALVTFSLVVQANHKIVISAGSKWLRDEYYSLAVELGGGAGLKSYLQQVDSDESIAIAQTINNKYTQGIA